MSKSYARLIQDELSAYYRKHGRYPAKLVIDKDLFLSEVADWITIPHRESPDKNQVFGIPALDRDHVLVVPPPDEL